jgi:3-hydroxy acid dehydrogenase/malonic semialdehyde reductase
MNKIILVTGATARFGKEIALLFARNGYNTIIIGRRLEKQQAAGTIM